jgi:hypothetical protein
MLIGRLKAMQRVIGSNEVSDFIRAANQEPEIWIRDLMICVNVLNKIGGGANGRKDR